MEYVAVSIYIKSFAVTCLKIHPPASLFYVDTYA